MSGEEKKARRMSRREFVCLGAGVALGVGATYFLTQREEPEEEKTFSGRGATKVKITVLKRFSTDEVVLPVKAPYGGPCPILREGQEFYVDAKRPQIPRDFCPYAWESMFPSDWEYYERNDPYVPYPIVHACPDGFRPVIFKLEWMD